MIIDINNKMVKVGDTEEAPIAFLEYRANADNKRVMTGPYGFLPHLDPYETGLELLYAVRDKYPRGEWVMETEPAWCARPEYQAMIQRAIDEGHTFYDEVGNYTPDFVGLLQHWEYRDLMTLNPEGGYIPTTSIQSVLDILAAEIAASK